MINAPEQSLCLANCPTIGWTTKMLEQLKKDTHCRKEEPTLVLLDYHEVVKPCHM